MICLGISGTKNNIINIKININIVLSFNFQGITYNYRGFRLGRFINNPINPNSNNSSSSITTTTFTFATTGNHHNHRRSRRRLIPFCCSSSSSSEKRIGEIDSEMVKAGGEIILTSGASGRINALFSMRVLKSLLMLINAFVLLLFFPFRGRKAGREEKSEGCGGGGSTAVGNRKSLAVVRVPSTIVPWKSSATATLTAAEEDVAARRAMAVRRVMNGGDEAPLTVREFSLFTTSRGDTLFTQSWSPHPSIKIRGLVVLLHGLNEHSGRYSDFAKQLNSHGFKVYGMDWTGHGGSDGLHGYVHSLDYAVADMKSFLQKVLAENPGLPCFCFGHSTGAAIVLKAVLDPKVETRIAGIVLTSPAVGVQPSHPIFAILAPVFSFLLPKYQFSAANKKGKPVSRDPEALVAKYSDPLVYTGSLRIRTGCEILRITAYLQQNLSRLNVPFLVLHGMADTVTDPCASQKLYEQASSNDKTLKLLEGLLHDLLFEPEKEEITSDIIDWLNSRL